MSIVIEFLQPFYVWLLFLLIILIFTKLFGWAKKKKTSALAFGILVQMFMPDPYVDRMVKVVQEDKKSTKESQEDGQDKNDT